MDEQQRNYLVETLVRTGYIKTEQVKQAFLHTSRENFLPQSLHSQAYVDTPLEIGQGQTISAPHMVAIMCEALDIKPGQKILEIGTGSGYHAAIVAYLTGENGHVYTIERFMNLAKNAQKNLHHSGISNVTVEVGDGSLGLPSYQPYDRIYVTCAAPKVPPPLLEQLCDGGKLLIPVGSMFCELQLIEKKGTHVYTHDFGGCVFVPLVGAYGF